ncbi:MAG: glycoside hydrolase family 15 protein, partial [Candidatus Gracilibacteria bacterium]|nr:glycoside hydrolase family 15 protein [Candidatus Gracilibacteria bacterium]
LEVTRRFFRFCSEIITEEGYFLHKYNPDGSVGSSWHPWYRDGKAILPIQEDETALVIYALNHHYEQFQDIEFIRPMYHDFIKPTSEFLESFISESTGLPSPSYDLWEEHMGIHTWTTASTIAGLRAAHRLALLMGHDEKADRYLKRVNSLTEALKKHLWNEEKQCFYKFLKVDEKGEIIARSDIVDASTLGVSLFGVLPSDDPMIIKNNETVKKHLWVQNEVGGIARFENDWYQRTESAPGIPGNPWVITTLWYAMWVTDKAKCHEDLQEALDLINWVADKATSTGVLPEQFDFRTGAPLSVSPLTWSHATFVEAVLKYCHKLEDV